MRKVTVPSSMDTFCWCPTRSILVSSVSWFLCWVLWQELIKICWQWRRGNALESFFSSSLQVMCQKMVCYMFNLDFSKVRCFGGKKLEIEKPKKET